MNKKQNDISDLLGEIADCDMPRTARTAPLGRPPLYRDAREMQAKVDEYFEVHIAASEVRSEDAKGRIIIRMVPGKPPTVAGLARFLGFADYRNIYRAVYKNDPDLNHVVKGAISRVAEFVQEQLMTSHATGPIFWLKNHGWADKLETEMYGKDGGAIETKDVSEAGRKALEHYIKQHGDKKR